MEQLLATIAQKTLTVMGKRARPVQLIYLTGYKEQLREYVTQPKWTVRVKTAHLDITMIKL